MLLPSSIHEPHTQMVIGKLKPVSKDIVNRLGDSQASVLSELSLCVNDSASGKLFDEVYQRGDVLGEGGYAVVRRCRHNDSGRFYAVKEVYNEDYESTAENIKEEIESLKKLRDGPYIVRLFDVFQSPDRTQLILEEMKGGDLLERLGEREVFPEVESRRLSRRLLEAVHFCHKKKICHRDIKLENILVADVTDDTKIKLGDFGSAQKITGPNCFRTLCGSPQYVAPELYMHDNGYDEQCDLWSAGICIYVFLGGYAPFDGPPYELPEMICGGLFEFHPPYWTDITDEPKQLIRRLLVVNPQERATLTDALDSDWLRRRDKESVMKYMEVTKGNDSSTNTFDAWVRLQNESQNTSTHSMMSMDGSYRSAQSASNHTSADEMAILYDAHAEAHQHIPDSIRSLKIDEL